MVVGHSKSKLGNDAAPEDAFLRLNSRSAYKSGWTEAMTGKTQHKDTEVQNAALQVRVAELEAELQDAHTDAQYAILTPFGIDHRWHERPANADTVIFFDIDDLHRHNAQWGYAGTDAHIRAVMSQIDHFWVFRWFSGDEFGLLCSSADAVGYAERVKRLLEAEGMTATFGIAAIIDNDLKKSMASATSLVLTAKANSLRGAVYEV